MTGGKLNVDFLILVFKMTKPAGSKFDEEMEAKYRKKVDKCNEKGKFLCPHRCYPHFIVVVRFEYS
jgi:hypothetical protein